jgi:hypothetical protein
MGIKISHIKGRARVEVLRRTFKPTMDEMTGGWRKLHNEEIHNSIIRMIKSRRMKMGGACSADGGNEKSIDNSSWKA